MSMLEALQLAALRAEEHQRREHSRQAAREAAQAVQELRRSIAAGHAEPPSAANVRPAAGTRIAFASAAARDAAMAADHAAREAAHQGMGEAGDGMPDGAVLDSLVPDSLRPDSMLERAMDQAFGDGLDTSREFQGDTASRVRVCSCDATPTRSSEEPAKKSDAPDFGPLADPELEKLAQTAATVTDAAECWRALLVRLKKMYPPTEANAARQRVWDRRRAILAQRRHVERYRARHDNGGE